MSRLLTIESVNQNLPLLLIYGEYSPLIEKFLKDNIKKFRVIFVSSKRADELSNRNDIYYLTYKEAQVLPRLEDNIDYALLFLTLPEQKTNLGSVTQKLISDRTKSLLLINALNFETFFDVIFQHKNDNIFHFGVLGNIVDFFEEQNTDELSAIIKTAIKKGEIRLTGNDLSPVFAISQKDALSAIYRLLLGNFNKKSLFYLFYNHPETILSATHLIGRVNPDLKITFSESSNKISKIARESITNFARDKLQMEEKYLDDYLDGFEKTFEKMFNKKSLELKKPNIFYENVFEIKERVAKKKVISPILTSLFFGFSLYVLINLLLLGGGIFYLKDAISNIANEKFAKVESSANTSSLLLNYLKPNAYVVLNIISLVDTNEYGKKTIALLENASGLAKVTGDTFKIIFNNPTLSETNIETLGANFSYLFTQGEQILLKQNNRELTKLLNPQYSKLLSLKSTVPYVLGFEGERNYLVLFQNNNELRPSGGFIGSVGQLSVKNGKIESLQVQDVYSLDGQLKDHVEPPFVVRRYLQPHLYLRDSNFSLDFQQTASTAAHIYNLETGKKPDAVIAVDFEVLKQILDIVGPISLPEYKTTITSKNIGDFLEDTIQTNFFPGSTQKKDVLNKVLEKTISKLNSNKNLYINVAKLIPNFLDSKNIMFAFSNESIQRIFNANNYGGQLYDTRIADKNTINDFLAINEANIGVNKANAYISRQVAYTAYIGQDKLESTSQITLTNISKEDSYKVYLRMVVPLNSSITQISIDGKKQDIVPAVTDPKLYESKNFKPPKGLEVESYSQDGRTIFAFITNVNSSSQQEIDVSYNNGASISLSTLANYSLLYSKQSGTAPYNLTTTIYFPDDYFPTDAKANSYGKNFLQMKKTITTDSKASVEIKKE